MLKITTILLAKLINQVIDGVLKKITEELKDKDILKKINLQN
ncbi:hypothetical protein [Borreliella lusitaniae]